MIKRNLLLKCKKCGKTEVDEIPKDRPGYYLANENTIIGPVRKLESIKRFKKHYSNLIEGEINMFHVDEKGNLKKIKEN